MGGFHLSGKECEAIIPETIRDIHEFNLNLIIPGHCTGWRAIQKLVEESWRGSRNYVGCRKFLQFLMSERGRFQVLQMSSMELWYGPKMQISKT